MTFRFGLLLLLASFFLGVFPLKVAAQQDSLIYKGLRISLFGFEVAKQKSESVSLRLNVVNTGRFAVSFGKKDTPAPEQLIIELDTVSLPVILQGRENLVTEAVRREKISLEPDETQYDLSVDIEFKSADNQPLTTVTESESGKNCPDLAFDTAYILEYTNDAMLLRFIIRNKGDAVARLLGASNDDADNLAVNVYFAGGTKLTRGAILADGIYIRQGYETLDGLVASDQIIQGDIRISLKNRTRFSPNLVFELDPFQTVQDCNRTNNTHAIVVEF